MGRTCPRCGNENDDSSEICKNCDATLGGDATLIHGRYKMTKPWVFSSFRAVYQAVDVRDKRRVYSVREFLPRFLTAGERMMARSQFESTLSKLKELSHVNMAHIVDYFVESNYFYVVYEYVDGEDMTKYLEPYKIRTGTGYPERMVSLWTLQLCNLLEYLHHGPQGTIFAVDLKPAGLVFRQQDENIVFIDMGLFKLLQILGPHYIITEDFQAYRKAAGKFESIGWDLFCLGNFMYYMLTGIDLIKMPDSYAVPVKKARPDLSEAMAIIVTRAIGRKGQSDYGDVRDLKRDLKERVPPLPLRAFDFYEDFVKKKTVEKPAEWLMLLGNEARTNCVGTPPKAPLKLKWITSLKPCAKYFLSAAEDYVYATSKDGMVYGIHKDTGIVEWKFYISKTISVGGIASGDTLYYITPFQDLVAIQRGRNNFKWKLTVNSQGMSTPILYDEILFVALYNGHILALNSHEGKILATFKVEGNILASPLLYKNILYVASLNKMLCAIDIETEQVLWVYESETGFSASPTLINNRLFIGSHDGTLTGINIQSGNPIWTRNFRGSLTQSVRANQDMIFLITQMGKLVALDPERGETIWERDLEGNDYEFPFALGTNLIYLVDFNKNLRCINCFTGMDRHTLTMSHRAVSQLICAHNQLYMVSSTGHLVAFGK